GCAMTTPGRSRMPPESPLALQLNPAALKPIIESVVAEVLAQLETERAKVGAKLAYPEAEAARLLSLNPHQLRDCRLRGEIAASVGPGRKILYTRDALVGYLLGRRWQAGN